MLHGLDSKDESNTSRIASRKNYWRGYIGEITRIADNDSNCKYAIRLLHNDGMTGYLWSERELAVITNKREGWDLYGRIQRIKENSDDGIECESESDYESDYESEYESEWYDTY